MAVVLAWRARNLPSIACAGTFTIHVYTMNEPENLKRILERDRVIAVVGLSTHAYRPSHSVAAYMQSHGYRIVPVNPAYANDTAGVLGQRCYASLAMAAHARPRARL